jgi:hypothetical protein
MWNEAVKKPAHGGACLKNVSINFPVSCQACLGLEIAVGYASIQLYAAEAVECMS